MKQQVDDTIPKDWITEQANPVIGGEAFHGQTSIMVAAGNHDVKSPDGWENDDICNTQRLGPR